MRRCSGIQGRSIAAHGEKSAVIPLGYSVSLVGVWRSYLMCNALFLKESKDLVVDVLGTTVGAETNNFRVVSALNSSDEADKG